MTDADIFEIAARQAEFQPDASHAIRAALSFIDRYPAAVRTAQAAAGDSRRLSLALILGDRDRYRRRDDIAAFFRQAALRGAAS